MGTPDKAWADGPDPLPDLVYYHNDHLGSSSIITNGQDDHGTLDLGDIVHQYVYTPFGDESYADTTYKDVSNRYTGQILDDETGLYYYNARYYDPEIARFVQADTVLPTTASQGLNRYSYCANNPLVYTDPSGNDFGLSALIAAAIIGAIAGAAAGATVSAIAGGNIGQGAMYGAIGGAMGGAFGYIGGQIGGWAGLAAGAAGAAGGGALMACITGGDVGMAAITGAITGAIGASGYAIGFTENDFINQLLTSSGVAGLVGGTTAHIQGGNFWTGFGQAAAGAAAGAVTSEFLKNGLPEEEDGGMGGDKDGHDGGPDYNEKTGFYIQQKNMSCLPASIRNELKWLGFEDPGEMVIREDVANALGNGNQDWNTTGWNKSNLDKLGPVYKKYFNQGFKRTSSLSSQTIMKHFGKIDGIKSLIAEIHFGNSTHAVLVTGVTNTTITYVDPWKGNVVPNTYREFDNKVTGRGMMRFTKD